MLRAGVHASHGFADLLRLGLVEQGTGLPGRDARDRSISDALPAGRRTLKSYNFRACKMFALVYFSLLPLLWYYVPRSDNGITS